MPQEQAARQHRGRGAAVGALEPPYSDDHDPSGLAPVSAGEHGLTPADTVAVEREPGAADITAAIAPGGPDDVDGVGAEEICWIGVSRADKVHELRIRTTARGGGTLVAGSPPHLRLPAAVPMTMLRTGLYAAWDHRASVTMDAVRPCTAPSRT